MDDRMPLESVIGIIRDVQSLEELGPSLEELMQRRAEEALPEPPWTGKEEEAAWRGDKAEDIFRLVDIEKIPLLEIPEAEPVGNKVFHIIDIIIHHRPLYLIRAPDGRFRQSFTAFSSGSSCFPLEMRPAMYFRYQTWLDEPGRRNPEELSKFLRSLPA